MLLYIEFSHEMIEKYSNITFYEYSSGGSGIVTSGQTDRDTHTHTHTQTDRHRDLHSSRFSQFHERSLLTEINLNYSTTLGSYRAVNTLCLNYKTQLLMLYWEIFTVFLCEIHTKHTNALCGQKVEFLYVEVLCCVKYLLVTRGQLFETRTLYLIQMLLVNPDFELKPNRLLMRNSSTIFEATT